MTPELIAAQATGTGQEIHRIALHDGKIIPAYGDFGVNTGPIHAYELDVETLDLVDAFTMQTEETWRMRTLNDGRLAVPYIDPRGYQDPAQGVAALRAVDGSWSAVTSIVDHPPIHAAAFLRRADGTIVVGGSSLETPNGVAAVWIDGVWEPISSGSNEFERVYSVAEVDGVLSAWVSNGGAPTGGRYERDDSDGTWTHVDPDAQVEETYPATTLGVDYVWTLAQNQSSGHVMSGTACAPFPTPTGALATALASWPTQALDVTPAADGSVWFLTPSRHVVRGNPDGTVDTLGTVDESATCIAADTDRGYVWFGTYDSRILRGTIPEPT